MINIVATRCHILMLKCTKFHFGWSSAPDPAWGAYMVGRRGRTGGKGKGRKRGREDKGKKGENHTGTFFPPLRVLG